jgi:hypothetical protein
VKSSPIVAALLLCAFQAATAQTPAPAPAPDASGPAPQAGFCLLTGRPPAEYSYVVVQKLKLDRETYGSVNDVLPKLIEKSRSLGADAVIDYNGSQRFGFFPWRFVRPVVSGTAIKWTPPRSVDCEAIGGHLSNGTLPEAPAR